MTQREVEMSTKGIGKALIIPTRRHRFRDRYCTHLQHNL